MAAACVFFAAVDGHTCKVNTVSPFKSRGSNEGWVLEPTRAIWAFKQRYLRTQNVANYALKDRFCCASTERVGSRAYPIFLKLFPIGNNLRTYSLKMPKTA
jgi:hypothetical protein